MKKTHTIDVLIRTTSPLHLAFPGNQADLNGQPTSRTASRKVLDTLQGGVARLTNVPVVPGNGLRGALRREGRELVLQKVVRGDEKATTGTYLGLSCGAASGSPDSTPLGVEEILRGAENCYMGLFGGGARMLQSRFQVTDVLPVLAITVENGMIPPGAVDPAHIPMKRGENAGDAPRPIQPWELLDVGVPIRRDDVKSVRDVESITRFVADPVASVIDQQALYVKDEGVRNSTAIANMMATEYVAPGTLMHFQISMSPDVTDGQIGFMLKCLTHYLNNGRLGGWSRCGWGRFSVVELRTHLRGVANTARGGECNDGDQFVLPKTLDAYLTAADESIEHLTMEEVASYFIDQSADQKAAKKAAKKTAKA